MAEDDSYEIMPYKEIVALKKELESLKKKSGNTSSQDLLNSMSKLTKSMDSMLQLFQTAAEEMKAEETTEEKFETKIKPLVNKIDEVIEQNKIIAEGMVAIADIVKGMAKGHEKPKHLPPLQPSGGFDRDHDSTSEPGYPPTDHDFNAPPDRQAFGAPPNQGLPPLGPPPPAQNKKRGLFGR